jgi:hypothetical protein
MIQSIPAAAAGALLLLLAAAPAARAAAPAPAAPKPAPRPSDFARAVAAIQGAASPGDGCPLKLVATAAYKPGTTTVSGTVTVTNPTPATVNVSASGGPAGRCVRLRARGSLSDASGRAPACGRACWGSHPFEGRPEPTSRA